VVLAEESALVVAVSGEELVELARDLELVSVWELEEVSEAQGCHNQRCSRRQ
jgi:hypothetical protein